VALSIHFVPPAEGGGYRVVIVLASFERRLRLSVSPRRFFFAVLYFLSGAHGCASSRWDRAPIVIRARRVEVDGVIESFNRLLRLRPFVEIRNVLSSTVPV
jgi:hypothetical protein